jgi:D-3-phosphoglycerate dehydrogenase
VVADAYGTCIIYNIFVERKCTDMNKSCVITVPNMGQNYDQDIKRLASLGIDAEWKKDSVRNSQDENVVIEHCKGYDIVIAANERWGKTAFQACKDKLKILIRYGIGFDNVDLAAASEVGIPVAILPGCNAEAVAEQAVALMLSVARRISYQQEIIKAGTYTVQTFATNSVMKKTIGLLGCGNIAKAVVRLLQGFDCTFLAYDIVVDKQFARRYGVTYVSLEEVLSKSDIISVHLPLLPETKRIINKDTIALMKPEAILVNTSRGGLVCSEELAEALRNKRILGAGLDVFENEVESDKPLGYQFLELNNVALTAHTASATFETFQYMMKRAIDVIECYVNGEPIPGLLNPQYKKYRLK